MTKLKMKYQLRTAICADLDSLHEVFETSIRRTCGNDYTERQITAWISKATPQRWKELFESDLHFILMNDNSTQAVVGFTSVNAKGYLHSLFVHPDYQRQGIGTSLLHAAEKFAHIHHAESLFSEVSKTAKRLFETNGYQAEKEQTIAIGLIKMSNFVMRKTFIQNI